MEDYTEDQELTQDNGQNETSDSNSAPRTVGQKAKNKLKETGRKIGDTFKEGIKQLWSKLPPKVKLIIIGIGLAILLIALLLLVILEFTTEASAEGIGNYMASAGVADTEAAKLYEQTGSLLLLTDDQAKGIKDEYLESIRLKTPNYYELFNSKVRNLVSDNSGVAVTGNAITLGENVTLYEHILNSERYNFNRIVWKEYDRNSTTGRDVSLKVDSETRLQYPDDAERDLSYFTNLVRPYLQSWVIPFTMMSGVATNASSQASENFAYEIMSDAYHKIEVEKRNLQSIDIFSEYKEYDKTTYTVTVTRTCEEVSDPDTQYTETYYELEPRQCTAIDNYAGRCPDQPTKGYKYVQVKKTRTVTGTKTVCNDSAPVTTSTTEHIVEPETETRRQTSTTSVYNYKKLQIFDRLMEYNINVTTYNLNNDPDMKTVTDSAYYEAEEPKVPNISENAGAGVYTATYVVKDGTKYEVKREWNDTITTSMTSREYDVSDIENSATSALDSSESTYYNRLKSNNEINLIDIMNASKDNYYNYLEGLNFSDNIGYTRDQLQVSYRLLNKYMSNMLEENSSGFAYGESLGLDIKYSGSLGGLSLEVVQNIDTNATYVAPIQDSRVSVSKNEVADGVYGYGGHTGIDLPFPRDYADASQCSDYIDRYGEYQGKKVCPLIAGPPVYTVQEGVLYKVAYSAYNKYHNTGTPTTSNDGNLKGGNKQGSNVIIKHTDANGKVTYSAYWHLYPDYEQLKELSNRVGETLPAGTYIGHMGNTGNSSGLHLHFEYSTVLWRLGNGETSLAILKLAGMVQ